MGGTLLVSRDTLLHTFYKQQLEKFGFTNITVTASDKDALDRLLRALKPGLVIIGAGFYECSTHYMMWELLQRFPKLNIAAVSIGRYPANLGMKCIVNGVKSFVMFTDGVAEFEKGMKLIRDGSDYISPTVREKINKAAALPKQSEKISPRQSEVIRLNSNGFNAAEICETLNISESTMYNHKQEIFSSLCVRNEREMINTARQLGIVNDNELVFSGENVDVKNKKTKKKINNEQCKRKVSN